MTSKHIRLLLGAGALILLLFLEFVGVIHAQTIPPQRGGTGYTHAPAKGDVLVGDGHGNYEARATSTLGISGGGGGPSGLTSIGFILPTGFSISTSPIVADGTTTISYAAGYSLFKTASGTAWQNCLVNHSTCITAGTLLSWVGNTLNVNVAGDWTGLFDGREGTTYLDRASHTGTQLAATISDFVAAARASISETITGIDYASGVFSITSGYGIPTTAKQSNWDTAYGWGNHGAQGYLTGNQTITLSGDASGSGATGIAVTVADDSHNHTGSTISGLDISDDTNLAVSAQGLNLSGDTVVLSGGYNVPKTASTSAWQAFLDLPSTIISAGTGLFGSGNTLACRTSSATTTGCLSAADWITLMAKEVVLSFSSPLVRSANTITCPTCAIGPSTAVSGSIVSANFNNSATAGQRLAGAGTANTNPCGTTNQNVWPIGGFVRNVTITTSGANSAGALMVGSFVVNCNGNFAGGTQGTGPGAAAVFSGAAAGAYGFNANSTPVYISAGSVATFAWQKNGTAPTAATVVNIAGEFVADSGSWTIFPAACNNAQSTGVSNYYGAYGGSCGGTSSKLTPAVPLPVAGTLQNYTFCALATTPTNNTPTWIMVNGASSTITATLPNIAPPTCVNDFTHTASVSAGDYFSFGTSNSATAAASFGTMMVGFTPSSGSTAVIGGVIGGTITTTPNYSTPLGSIVSATIANSELGLPRACTISKLYVVQSTANAGGVTTTFTLEKNGSDTTITGTITSANGTGAVAVDTLHSVSYAKGDLITLKYVTGSGTSGTIGGWAVACD